MTPEIGFNGKRIRFDLRDVVFIVIQIAALLGAWYGMKGEVSKISEWGNPPGGRLYVLEQDVSRHHNVTEAVQQQKIDADHDKVISLEGKIDNLTRELERNNRLLERFLNKR